MKSIKVITAAITLLTLTVCTQAQFRRTVYGNGDVIKEDRSTASFTGIKVSSGIDLYLSQGDIETIRVEADENLIEYIVTEVKGGVLNVYTDANIRRAEMKRVYVTMGEISSIKTSSAGDVIGETPVKSNRLELSASSAGNIKLEVYADDLEVNVSSSGDITLSGEAEMLEANLSSAGDLNAFNLLVQEADVSVSSAGDADINVSEKLIARASSAGDINYRGNPGNVDAHSSSAGGIHKR